MSTLSPFTRTVVEAMRTLYPEKYADKSFDNTGLLLASPLNPSQPRQRNSALLTIDLTTAVADEAIRRRDSIVISYHPIIFRPLKSLTLNDTQQTSLLRLAQAGISVYSPHTAVDAAPGGMGDWLCDVVTGCYSSNSNSNNTHTTNMAPKTDKTGGYTPVYPNPSKIGPKQPSQLEHTRSTIHPLSQDAQDAQDTTPPGMGRLVTLHTPQPLHVLLEHIAHGTGLPSADGILIAVPQPQPQPENTTTTTTTTSSTTAPDTKDAGNIPICTIGVCPGSGAGVLLKPSAADGKIPDLLFTGEMSHHETLAAVERGSVVVAVRHSNSERGFLHAVMRERLGAVVGGEWDGRHRDGDGDAGVAIHQGKAGEVLKDDEVVVEVSEMDRDPFGVLLRA